MTLRPNERLPATEALRANERDGELYFDVRVAPRASREAILGVHDGALKVALSAPPVDGAANAALCALLAKKLGVPKSALRLVNGERSKTKTLAARGVPREALLALLG